MLSASLGFAWFMADIAKLSQFVLWRFGARPALLRLALSFGIPGGRRACSRPADDALAGAGRLVASGEAVVSWRAGAHDEEREG